MLMIIPEIYFKKRRACFLKKWPRLAMQGCRAWVIMLGFIAAAPAPLRAESPFYSWYRQTERETSAPLIEQSEMDFPMLQKASPASALPDVNDVLEPEPTVQLAPVPNNCSIVGEVSDAMSLNPLAGVFLVIGETGRTVESSAQGKFEVSGLPQGAIAIEATKLGYFTETVLINTLPTQVAKVRIALRAKPTDGESEVVTLEEETIVGEYQEDDQPEFDLGLKTDSNTLVSGISKEEFSRTGVSDAAGAVGKVAGANIVGGKFAVVRGLADRYVTTLFNGAAISSADPSRKAVQLDIFPTTAIQSININKTHSPNLPGDFGGGTIQIQSLNIPSERIIEFKYKMTWNSTLEDRMLVHPNRKPGFWGDQNNAIPDAWLWNLDENGEPRSFNVGGNRVVPGRSPTASQQQQQIAIGNEEQAKADQALAGVLALHNSQGFMPKVEKPEEGKSFSMVYGDKFDFDNGNQLGFIAAFQHSTEDEVNALGPENRITSPSRSWLQESYSREVDWSLYLAGGYKIGDHHQLNATYFRKRILTDQITHGKNFAIEGDGVFGALAKNDATLARYGASAVYNKEFWTIDPVIRDTEIMQLSGNHKNDHGTHFSWGLSQSSATESRPHTSTFQHGQLDFTNPLIFLESLKDPNVIYNPSLGQIRTIEYQTFVNDGIGSLDSSRETQRIEEKAQERSAELKQEFYLTDKREDGAKFELSLGVNDLEKERTQEGRVYLMRTASWERWVARNPPAWWANSAAVPFSNGSPLSATVMPDGTPLPAGFRTLGEYLASNPDALAAFFNGYGNERFGGIPGTGTGANRGTYVQPDGPYFANGSGLEVRNINSDLSLTSIYSTASFLGDIWRIGGGVRWEEETKSYQVAADPLTRLLEDDPSRTGSMVTNAIIPSAFAGLDIIPEQLWVNLAWSETVARPTFHEFLPIESIAQDTGILRRGNASLGETQISNLDISIEWAPTESISCTLSAFKKDLLDPIVVVQRVDQGVNSNTYINGDSGEIKGFEIEGRWKPEAWPFSLTGNYTFINSSLLYEVNQGINVTELETRFPFQPSQILNLTLGWEPEESPWSAFLTANFTDEYPTILRSDPNAYDVWLKPQFTLDLMIARKFAFDSFTGTLTLGIKNLTKLEREYEYRGEGASDGLSYTAEELGMSYSVEFKAAF